MTTNLDAHSVRMDSVVRFHEALQNSVPMETGMFQNIGWHLAKPLW